MTQQRAFFRLTYHAGDHAWFAIFTGAPPCRVAVVDVSASGMCFRMPDDQHLPQVGAGIRGELQFQDGSQLGVTGHVLRVAAADRRVVMRLDPEINMKVLMDQHRQWIQKYRASS